INNNTLGDVKIFTSTGLATLKFFAFANENQMPLRSIVVDWGDNDFAIGNGKYRNHRGGIYSCGTVCTLDKDSAACVPASSARDFGHIVDQTCDNTYFRFDHVYKCNVATSKAEECGAKDFPNGCCMFTPKVQVKDNWGWCNSSRSTNEVSCTPGGGGSEDNLKGCYDGSHLGGQDGCDLYFFPNSAVYYKGKIIVAPR
ncbi:MAG: hypothetical protein AAB649_03725, partial [Patescibacteria group bacterium]